MDNSGPQSTIGDSEAGSKTKPGSRNLRSDNKTVTFGDAAAVRSLPWWALAGAIFVILLWFLATTAWGFPSEFKAEVDAQELMTAQSDAEEAGLAIPSSTHVSDRDYYRLCSLADDAQCDVDGFTQIVSPLTFPSPSDTWNASTELFTDGYRNVSIWKHIWASLWRVMRGMFWGCLVGIPLGLAMGLSSKARGFLDPMVEGFRVIPPLALVTLFGLIFGIGDSTAVPLLIFASIWIMIIAARAGVRNASLSKVRAAYSLGATKPQLLRTVLIPNALPEIFTGLRVALGVSWGTLVAAELFGVSTGLGAMIQQAKNFSRLDVIVVAIVVIAVLGVAMDAIIRLLEAIFIPWQGKG